MAGIGLFALADQQRAQLRRVGLELARSVATAVDARLRSSAGVLEALSTSLTLDRPDLEAFRERARRVLALQPDWAGIVLTDPAGRSLVDTRQDSGAGLPPSSDRRGFDLVARRHSPVIG